MSIAIPSPPPADWHGRRHDPSASPSPLRGSIVLLGGSRHRLLASYPPLRGLRLHSLASPARYDCGHCRAERESTIVALAADRSPVCPDCFGTRLRDAAEED